MTKEIFELLKKMDIQAAETQMALRCAPFIAGLRTSNLLIVKNGQAAGVQHMVENTQFQCFNLFQDDYKAVLLLYSGCRLEAYLRQKEAKRILLQQGYADLPLSGLLCTFAARYKSYMQGSRGFPHEMGLFLGYPPEDVEGFIENKGTNCLYTGYWKVYGNALEKIRLFQKFDYATEALLRLVADGIRMEDMLKYA